MNMDINKINLRFIQLKTFTEQDAEDYCQINNINPDNITQLYLYNNELTDISGIKIFKNLEVLDLDYNQIKDISVLKSLNNIKELSISELELKSNQIKYINSLKKLRNLYCNHGFENIDDLFKLNSSIENINPFPEEDNEGGYYNDWGWREKGSIEDWGGDV